MKLSLRYLLAYLDDILAPADTAEVSRLLKEDLPAAELVQRIKEVIRKRRLAAPEVFDETPGKDANDVAEYLDNLMSPVQINIFEQGCLDSDEQVAEVAATHQILTLVLGGEADIPSSTRERLEQIAASVSAETPATDSVKAPIPLSGVDIPVTNSSAESIPPANNVAPTFELPKQNTNWQQRGAFVAIGLLFAAWIYSIATDDSLRYQEVKNNSQEQQNQLAANGNHQDVQNQIKPKNGNKNPTSPVTHTPPAKSPSSETSAKAPDEFKPPIVKSPESTTPNSQPEPKNGGENVAMNNPAKNPEMDNTNPTKNKTDNKNPALAEPVKPTEKVCFTPSIVYLSENQGLFRQAVGQSAAILISEMAAVEPSDQLFCTQYSEAEFSIGEKEGKLKLLENTAVTLLAADKKSCLGFDIKQGRLIFTFQAEPEPKAPRRIRFKLQELTWYFELPKESGSILFEVVPQQTTHYEKLPSQGLFTASVFAIGPPVQMILPEGKKEELKLGRKLLPLPESIQQNEPKQDEAEPEAEKRPEKIGTTTSLPIPEWAVSSSNSLSNTQKKTRRDFLKKIANSVNLWLDLEGAASDPNARIAEQATRALSLGSRTESLVTVLVHSPHEESRTAAIAGLRTWLPQAPENREILRTLLSKSVNEKTAFVVYHLLWGYDHEDAKDANLSRELVDWLRHDHVAVRELSIYWISHLTGQKLGYRPLAPLKTREQGAISWERHLNRVGALVASEPEE